VCATLRAQGRFWDLEALLASSVGSYMPEDRRAIFLSTLETYADQGLYDKAVALASQIKEEGLDFPQFQAVLADLTTRVATLYPAFYSPMVTTATTTPAPSEVGSIEVSNMSMSSSVSPVPPTKPLSKGKESSNKPSHVNRHGERIQVQVSHKGALY
jgi:hypothetical protein